MGTVPVVSSLLFFVVLWILYKTEHEISVEKIESFVDKIPLLNKLLTTEWIAEEDDEDTKDTKKEPKDTPCKCVFVLDDATKESGLFRYTMQSETPHHLSVKL